MKKIFKRKVPFIYQIEATECGAACLGMVLAYYRKYVPLAELRRACCISRDGSKLSLIMGAAKQYGLKPRAYRLSDPAGEQLPGILFWNRNHFVVLEEYSDKRIMICDPAAGRRIITQEEFQSCYSGIMLCLEKTEDFREGGKPFSALEIVRDVLQYKTGAFAFVGVMILILNLIGILIPGMVRLFVDEFQSAIGNSGVNFTIYFSMFAGIVALQLLLTVLRNHIILRANHRISAQINSGCITKLLQLPLSYYQTRSNSALITRLKSIDTLSEFISSKLIPVFIGLFFSIVYLSLLIYYSPLIALAVGLIIAAVIAILIRMITITKTGAASASNASVNFSTQVWQNLRLFDTIKSTASEKAAMDRMVSAFVRYENSNTETMSATCCLQAIPTAVPLLIQTVTIIIGGCQVISGDMTLGAVLACQSIGLSIFAPITDFVLQFQTFQDMNADIRGIMDIENEAVDEMTVRDGAKEAAGVRGGFELRDVSFGYNKAIPPIIKHVSFAVQPGKSVAIVGASGSGKTTLLRLMEGLYTPDQGEICVDGMRLSETDRAAFADSVAIVSQTASLFTGTVRENLTMFDKSVSMERIRRAAEDACILQDINERKLGFMEMITPPNICFSGGQVQRMMIARALIKEPSVLILDEATGALDPVVEETVMQNIRRRGITTIIVAHRLSTIRDCDEILLLEKGEIVQRGDHDSLMQDKDGLYFRLVASEEDV